MSGRARNFRFRSCYKDGCISTSKTKTKIFVSAHVIRTLFLVTAHEFQRTKIWFFVAVFRVLEGVALVFSFDNWQILSLFVCFWWTLPSFTPLSWEKVEDSNFGHFSRVLLQFSQNLQNEVKAYMIKSKISLSSQNLHILIKISWQKNFTYYMYMIKA